MTKKVKVSLVIYDDENDAVLIWQVRLPLYTYGSEKKLVCLQHELEGTFKETARTLANYEPDGFSQRFNLIHVLRAQNSDIISIESIERRQHERGTAT